MASKRISELDPAILLDGTEEVPVVQGGNTVKTTTQDIADLAAVPTLQQVTSADNKTTDDIFITDDPITLSVYGFFGRNNISFADTTLAKLTGLEIDTLAFFENGFLNGTLLKPPTSSTAINTLLLPDSSGNLAISVNGIGADAYGNVTIPALTTPNLQQVLNAGNIASSSLSVLSTATGSIKLHGELVGIPLTDADIDPVQGYIKLESFVLPGYSASYTPFGISFHNSGRDTNLRTNPFPTLGSNNVYLPEGTGVLAILPYTGSAGITGSLDVVGPTSITGSLNVSGSITLNNLPTATSYLSKVTLSSSDIANMDSVQIIAVPAPPSGKAIYVTNIATKTGPGTGWTTSNNILLRPVGGSSGIVFTQSQPLSLQNLVSSENVNTSWWSPAPSSVALEFRGSQGVPPSGGTLGATVYITYQLIDL